MNFNQVIVRFVLKSEEAAVKNGAQIYSIELNLIENANIKLVRDEVSSFCMIYSEYCCYFDLYCCLFEYSRPIQMSQLNSDLV